jgi:hypothetical protein
MAGYGIDAPQASKSTLLLRFEEVLSEHRLSGRRCLLIVDEVQNLSLAALEELRMLSNLTEGGRASLQTILLGQPQFRRMLASPDLDQLRQRVIASYHLGPLTSEETRAYILHRLGTVGWRGRPRWDDAAFAAVFAHSGGLPRRINRLCSRVLLYGALEETDQVTQAMVDTTAEELAQDLEGGRPAAASPDFAAPGFATPGFAVMRTDLHADLREALRGAGNGHDAAAAGALAELRLRVEALESRVAMRERVFQRLLDTLNSHDASQR